MYWQQVPPDFLVNTDIFFSFERSNCLDFFFFFNLTCSVHHPHKPKWLLTDILRHFLYSQNSLTHPFVKWAVPFQCWLWGKALWIPNLLQWIPAIKMLTILLRSDLYKYKTEWDKYLRNVQRVLRIQWGTITLMQVISRSFWGETVRLLQVHKYMDSQQMKMGQRGLFMLERTTRPRRQSEEFESRKIW